jgi:hypothetical protein
MREAWRWMISDASLPIRIAIGLSIFATLAITDYRANRERATRWREYAFLFACVGVAIAYGILNDLITSRISIEYFLFGKGVAERVSADVAAHPELHRGRLDLEAIRIGTLATWSAGLIAGAAILVTNSIGARPRLRMRHMLRFVPILAASAILFAALGGWIGHSGFFARFSDDFAEMLARDEMRPRRFMAVFGIHLGGYLGALLGLVIVCVLLWRKRVSYLASDRS